MTLRLAALISALAVFAAVPAGAQAANVIRTTSMAASTVVPAGGTSTRTLECPSPWVAVSGAVTSRGTGVTVRRSRPGDDASSWTFRLAADTSGGRRVRTLLRCVRLEVPAGISGARLNVRTIRRPAFRVPEGATAPLSLRCGRAWVATGYGFGERRGSVRLASAVPSAHGWDFQLENTGAADARVDLHIRCLRQSVAASRNGASTELRFAISRPSSSNVVGPGRPRFSHRCGGRRLSLATGSIVDPLGTIELANSSPLRLGWGRWTFRLASGGERVQTFLVCLARGSGFR
jgi:hypothetical protein